MSLPYQLLANANGKGQEERDLPWVVMPPFIVYARTFLLAFPVICLGEMLGFALRLTEENKAEVTEKEVQSEEK